MFKTPLVLALLLAPAATAAQEPELLDPVADAHAGWNADHGGEWLLRRHEDMPTGRYLFGLQSEPLFVPQSDQEFFELARMVVEDAYGMFAIDVDTLVTDEVVDLDLSSIGSTDKVAVSFTQWVRGIPVVDGSVSAIFTPRGGLLGLDSRALPGVEDLILAPADDPFVAVSRARAEFSALEGVEAAFTGSPELVILGHASGKWARPRLAWSIELRNETDPGNPHGLRILLATDDGSLELLEAQELIHHQNQASGNVESYATPGTSANSASNPPTLHLMPHMTLTSSAGSTSTDANGDFTLDIGAATSVDITATYTGSYCRVVNQSGANHSTTQTFAAGVPGTLTMNTAQTEFITAEASCFDSVNDMRTWLKSIDPNDTHLDFQVVANANLNQNCNAYFNGGSINMYTSGGGCANTAFSTVIAHEEGHWANVLYGSGNGSDGFGEGNADVFAMYLYDTPIVGEGFSTGGGIIRTGWNTRQFCGNSNPGCHGGVHANGEVLMGALWKVRNNLNTTHGNAAGDLIADTLFFGWMNAYNDGQIRTIIEDHWLTLDDNNGNIFDGTPNFGDIDGGFVAQGFPGIQLQLISMAHTPLGDTLDEQGPYLVSADVSSLIAATITDVDLTWSVDGGATSTVPMVNVSGDTYEADIPGQISPAQVSYHIDAEDSAGNSLSEPLSGEHNFIVGVRTSIYFNDFEAISDEGWTHAQVATQDDWQRGYPQGKVEDPVGAYSGAKCWGNDLGNSGWNGAYQPNVHNYLDSPAIDCSGFTGVRLTLQRWLAVESGVFDHAEILVNGNLVWSNPTTGNLVDTEWTGMDVDISQWADNNPAVTVRFQMRSDAGLEFGGWNIDDFELSVLEPVGANTDTLLLSGPTSAQVGQTLTFNIFAMTSNAPWWLLASSSNAGQVFQGHNFDVGGTVQILRSGTATSFGSASPSVTVPAAAAGQTYYLEAASLDNGLWVDSNLLTLVIQ